MNEVYLGSVDDRVYIQNYLENIRKLDPIEVTTIPKAVHLANACATKIVDIDLFHNMVHDCIEYIEEKYGISIERMDISRYYVAFPTSKDAIGGFHDTESLGYQYWYHASFVAALNPRFASIGLRTVEMVRNFLHDCLHHSTFRSYRRATRVPSQSVQIAKNRVPEIYREQYGFNFRNSEGASYSSPTLTLDSPRAINLNLLMDGVVVLAVSEAMKNVPHHKCSDKIEEEIQKEILLEPFKEETLPRAHSFLVQVTDPSRKFLDYWGKDRMMTLALQTMISGNMSEIKCFFQEQTNTDDAWERLFKQPGFSLPNNPNI